MPIALKNWPGPATFYKTKGPHLKLLAGFMVCRQQRNHLMAQLLCFKVKQIKKVYLAYIWQKHYADFFFFF